MHDMIADIHAILDDEKAAILAARFAALPALEAAKLQLVADLSDAKPNTAALGRIKAKLEENQTLLASATAGVAAARTRLQALQDVRAGLNVYDDTGTLAKVPAQHHGIEKKA